MKTRTGKTAGKTARSDTRRWRTVTKNGVTCLVAPDGTRYSGTAKEIRDAALMPDRRKDLADALSLARFRRDKGTFNAEQYKGYCCYKRRDAILFGVMDARTPHMLPIDAAQYIKLKAGARLVCGDGESFADLLKDWIDSAIDGLLDVADERTGKRELPLTRHEARFLAGLKRGASNT